MDLDEDRELEERERRAVSIGAGRQQPGCMQHSQQARLG